MSVQNPGTVEFIQFLVNLRKEQRARKDQSLHEEPDPSIDSHIHCIVPGLYLTNISGAADKDLLNHLKIKAIVNASNEANAFEGEFAYYQAILQDDAKENLGEHLEHVLEFIHEHHLPPASALVSASTAPTPSVSAPLLPNASAPATTESATRKRDRDDITCSLQSSDPVSPHAEPPSKKSRAADEKSMDTDTKDKEKTETKEGKEATERKLKGNVLVHCAGGVSRSASFVIAFLIKHYGMTYDSALSRCKKARHCVQPNDGFERQLREFEAALRSGPAPASAFAPAVEALGSAVERKAAAALTITTACSSSPLDEYAIVEDGVLGIGNHGIVFDAVAAKDGRKVAIKVEAMQERREFGVIVNMDALEQTSIRAFQAIVGSGTCTRTHDSVLPHVVRIEKTFSTSLNMLIAHLPNSVLDSDAYLQFVCTIYSRCVVDADAHTNSNPNAHTDTPLLNVLVMERLGGSFADVYCDRRLVFELYVALLDMLLHGIVPQDLHPGNVAVRDGVRSTVQIGPCVVEFPRGMAAVLIDYTFYEFDKLRTNTAPDREAKDIDLKITNGEIATLLQLVVSPKELVDFQTERPSTAIDSNTLAAELFAAITDAKNAHIPAVEMAQNLARRFFDCKTVPPPTASPSAGVDRDAPRSLIAVKHFRVPDDSLRCN